MKKTEAKMILATLVVAFPTFYKNADGLDAEATVNLWTLQFADYTYEMVNTAVQALISTKIEGYPPTIGEVKEKIRMLFSERQLTDSEAWALVSKATRNSAYGSEKEFKKLPPDVQRAVGSPEILRSWAVMDAEAVETVVASNFKRTYRAIALQEKEQQMLPQSVRDMLPTMAKPMLMEGDE